MKIRHHHFWDPAELSAGARASARFNVRTHEVTAQPPECCALKRRERRAPGNREGGMVTVIFIALLAIMMILLTANSRALLHLRREVKFLEQQQIQRLNASATNTVPATINP
jgi:hypothetical protein